MSGWRGIRSLLFSLGGTRATNGLDDKRYNVESGEDDDIVHRLEKGIGLSDNYGTTVNKIVNGSYRLPMVRYKAAEKKAGEMIRQTICIMK